MIGISKASKANLGGAFWKRMRVFQYLLIAHCQLMPRAANASQERRGASDAGLLPAPYGGLFAA